MMKVKKNKKLLAILLTTVMSLAALTGCGESPVESETGSESQVSATVEAPATTENTSQEDVTINFWHHYSAQSAENETLMNVLIPEFEKENPGIKVNAVSHEWADLHQKILISAQSNTLPDVARLDSAWVPEFQKMGILTALDEEMPDFDEVSGGLLESAMSTAKVDGHFYGLALNTNTKILFYNVQAFKDAKTDYLIAIGGGSSMDTAKAIGIIINNPEHEDVISLEGAVDTKNKSVPIFAVPTTAGTAAEVTINYVITDAAKNRKMVCVDPHDIPVVAFIDPDMMSSMPKGLTAATGMDALTHAIEGYITAGAWELSDMFHLKAIEIISRSLRGAVENTPEGREGMALGQYVAGMGFSNVGLGIVHSMAHPLGALYDTPHGIANAIILPTVMEYNAEATGEKYRDIAKAMGVEGTENMSQEEYRKAAVDAVRKLSQDVGIPADLKEIVKKEDIPFLAQSAYDDACRPGNPKETSVEDITKLYESLL